MPKRPIDAPKRGPGAPKKPEGALRTHQLRVLKALHANRADNYSTGLNVVKLESACKVSDTILKVGLGATEPEKREPQDTKVGYRSLLSRGMVKCERCPDRGIVYYLTARGHATVKKHEDVLASLDEPKRNGRTKGETPAT